MAWLSQLRLLFRFAQRLGSVWLRLGLLSFLGRNEYIRRSWKPKSYMVDRANREQYAYNSSQYSNCCADAKSKREPSEKRGQNHCPIELHEDASDLKGL